MDEKTLLDLDLAEKTLKNTDCSIVVVKNSKILSKKQGKGVRPILEIIDDLGEKMHGSSVADRILGKASALLCVYSKVNGVYSPQSTKTAIAVLIKAGIPGQTDEMIPFIKNKNGDDMCPFEKVLLNVDSPEEAYNILKKALQ